MAANLAESFKHDCFHLISSFVDANDLSFQCFSAKWLDRGFYYIF